MYTHIKTSHGLALLGALFLLVMLLVNASNRQLDTIASTISATSASAGSQLAQASGADDITSGLLAHWTFDDGSGSTVADSSGSGINGTISTGTSSPQWVGGRIGGALALDGQDDSVSFGAQPSFGNLGDITMSAWVYPKAPWTDPYPFMGNFSIGSNSGFAMGAAWDGTANWREWIGSKGLGDMPAPPLNQWTQIAFTYDAASNTLVAYSNATVRETDTGPGGNIAASSLPFTIGTNQGTAFNGFIDDVRIYNRALTAQEITDLYNYSGAAPASTGNSGSSNSSAPSTDTAPPSVPGTPSSSNIGNGQVSISWEAATDNVAVAGYKIYRNNLLLSSVTSGTSYIDSGLTPGATYIYRISAFDAAGNESGQSAPLSVTTTGQSATSFGTTEISLPKVIQGRQTYAGQHIMWKDPSGHINIINSFGGADLAGNEDTYIHYINTFTGAHALVQGGPCSFGRNSIYDPVANKFYYYGEYCSRQYGGGFNEFDPVTMTNTVIKFGGSTWWNGQQIALGADNRIYFTAMDSDNQGGHLYSYDPAVGASSWTDYGVIYGTSNGISPGVAVDTKYIYVNWQDTSGNWHLMVHPIGSGSWKEISFPDGQLANGNNMVFRMDNPTKNWFEMRTINGVTAYYWLQNGGIVAIPGGAPDIGSGVILELNTVHMISMMDYGNYNGFLQAFNYDMNWDNLIPNTANPISTVTYGPHSSWNYPTSGFTTSSLNYTGPWYSMPVSSIVPHPGTSNFYAFGQGVADYNYGSQVSTPVTGLTSPSPYYALRVPAAYSPLGVDEIYYAGYPDQLLRWNPSAPITGLQNSTNPLFISLPQDMDYRLFMDYDSSGDIWVGSNNCGATAGCIDFGSVAWYNPRDGSKGEMFQGVWTGGNPPATGNGIKFGNLAMADNRSKVVVSADDGNLTVINALTKTIEGRYMLGARAYMVEVANDEVLGVTTSADAAGERVFLFQPSTRTMIKGPQPIGVSGYTFGAGDGRDSRRAFKLELGPDGYAWLYVGNSIYRVNPSTLAFQFVVTDMAISSKLVWSTNKLDLIVYGQTNVSYFPNLLEATSGPATSGSGSSASTFASNSTDDSTTVGNLNPDNNSNSDQDLDASNPGAGNSTTPPASNTPTPDTTPPVISGIASGSVTATGAIISWTTNEAASDQVQYGLTTSYGNSTSLNSTLGTSHTQTIASLQPNTLYHYKVVSVDSSGNSASSADQTFTTLTPPDTTPPVVAITAPSAASSLSGSVSLSAAASDNVGVASVQFKLDGANLGPELFMAPYSGSWNTAAASNGTHVLTAVASDVAGNTTTSASVTVTVSNTVVPTPPADTTPPTVSISSPVQGQTLAGTVPLVASASDDVGVSGVQFQVDGANLGAELFVAPYSGSWNTAGGSNGEHGVTAVATDAAGNVMTSAPVDVAVSNLPPSGGDTVTPPAPAPVFVPTVTQPLVPVPVPPAAPAVTLPAFVPTVAQPRTSPYVAPPVRQSPARSSYVPQQTTSSNPPASAPTLATGTPYSNTDFPPFQPFTVKDYIATFWQSVLQTVTASYGRVENGVNKIVKGKI